LSRQPTLSSAIADGRLVLTASGSWTAVHAHDLEPLVDKWRAFDWHVIELDGHDIAMAWPVRHLRRVAAAAPDARVDRARAGDERRSLPERYRGRSKACSAPIASRGHPAQGKSRLLAASSRRWPNRCRHGARCNRLREHAGGAGTRRSWPRSCDLQPSASPPPCIIWTGSAGTVPIILLITFLIGGIIAQRGFFHFRKFGADEYVVDMVGILSCARSAC
jgi:phospholipid/cholesterol/gamma-HCH transport system permease protein